MIVSATRPSFPTRWRTTAAVRRLLWTASTLLSTSPSSLLSHLKDHTFSGAGDNDSSLTYYALSKNIPAELIPSFIDALSPSSPTSSSIGCLSEVLSSSIAQHVGLSTSKDEPFSVALARFERTSTSQAVPFHSKLKGRPNIALGREIKQGPREDRAGSEGEDSAFEAFLSGKKWGFGDGGRGTEKPQGLEALEAVRPADVKQVLCFTTDRAQPFLGALTNYRNSATLGLVASSTPFHSPTNAPYSMFFNGSLVTEGAIGVAVVERDTASKSVKVDHGGLEQLGETVEVTSAKGNIILTLSGQNAARLLLNAVQGLPSSTPTTPSSVGRGEEKEKHFFAAVFETKPSTPLDLSQAKYVARIMAGDPSRGAMSVDTEEEVRHGSWIVFLHRSTPQTPVTKFLSPSPTSNSIVLLSTSASHSTPLQLSQTLRDGVVVKLDSFVASSENGVLLSRMGADSWLCNNEGAAVELELNVKT